MTTWFADILARKLGKVAARCYGEQNSTHGLGRRDPQRTLQGQNDLSPAETQS